MEYDLTTALGLICFVLWTATPMTLLAWRFFFVEKAPWWLVIGLAEVIGWGLLILCSYLGLPEAYRAATEPVWPHLAATVRWGWFMTALLFALYLIPYYFAVWVRKRLIGPYGV